MSKKTRHEQHHLFLTSKRTAETRKQARLAREPYEEDKEEGDDDNKNVSDENDKEVAKWEKTHYSKKQEARREIQ